MNSNTKLTISEGGLKSKFVGAVTMQPRKSKKTKGNPRELNEILYNQRKSNKIKGKQRKLKET